MANAREIQNRMKSIRDTMKITNAMYMISSTKLRRARKALEETEPYFFTLQTVLTRILRHVSDVESVFFDKRPNHKGQERKKGLIVVTADKGMAGAYNHNVLKLAQETLRKEGSWKLYVVGESGRHYFTGKGIAIEEQFHYTAQNPSLHRARFIGETVIEAFLQGELDEVSLIYTVMENGLVSEPSTLKLLPLKEEDYVTKAEGPGVFADEIPLKPSPQAVLRNVIPGCIVGYIYGALVESFCSEQNARMMAMEAANKNASSMIRELSVTYNRARQAMITQEITEVVAGAKAQKKKKQQRRRLASGE